MLYSFKNNKHQWTLAKLDDLALEVLNRLLPTCSNNELLYSLNNVWNKSVNTKVYDDNPRLLFTNGGFNATIGAFNNVAFAQFVNASNNSQDCIKIITNGSTRFKVNQNGDLDAQSLTAQNLTQGYIGADANKKIVTLANPIQTLSVSGNQLSISNGNTVTIQGGGGGQNPSNTVFVSPAFDNTSPFFQDISNAITGSALGDTIIVYDGTYNGNYTIDNRVLVCLGDVLIYTLSLYESCTLQGGSYGLLAVGGDYNTVNINHVNEITITNSYNNINYSTANVINLQGTRNKIIGKNAITINCIGDFYDYIEFHTCNQLNVNSNVNVNINYQLLELNLTGYANTTVKGDCVEINCLDNSTLSYKGNCGTFNMNSYTKAFADCDKIEYLNLTDECKLQLRNAKIENTIDIFRAAILEATNCKFLFDTKKMLILNDGVSVKLIDSFISGYADYVVWIKNYTKFQLINTVIFNDKENSESVHLEGTASNTDIYCRSHCFANKPVSGNITYIYAAITVDEIYRNEFII